MLNPVDFGQFNQLLTQFLVERGRGGEFVQDQLAPPFVTDTQSYLVPNYVSGLVKQGITNDEIGPSGAPNIVEDILPTFVPGSCTRRGLATYTLDEIKAQPNGDLFASEEILLADLQDDLRLRMEKKVKAMLDARKSVSGFHNSPTVKWDAASGVATIVNLEAGLVAAAANSGRGTASGNWKLVIPPLVQPSVAAYVRDVLKYTDSQYTLGGMPRFLGGMPVISPGAMQNTAAAGQTASIVNIWNTDDVYLVYVDPSFSSNRRALTAMAQMRWEKVSPSYGAYNWRDPNPMVLRNWVGTDIFDNLELISADGIYVLDNVLT